MKKCNLITKEEAENIIKYTKKVLEAAIEKGGTTIRTYSSVDGVHGLFQNELCVHGKDKNNCPICNTKNLNEHAITTFDYDNIYRI